MAGPAPSRGRRKSGYQRTGRYGRGPGDQRRFEDYGDRRGFRGLVGFVLFLLIMAGVVLVLMMTVARPVLRMVVVPWADGNPGALRIGFVAELVREDLGDALTSPASTDPSTAGVRRGDRRHAGDPGAAPAGGRDHHQPAGVPVRGAHERPRVPAERRAVRHGPQHDARPGCRGPDQQPRSWSRRST